MIHAPARAQRGVTLMELLAVMVIIGLLAAIAIPSYSSYRYRANRQVGGDCVTEAQRRLENYFSHQNVYPTDLSDASLRYGTATPSCGDEGLYTLALQYGGTGSCPATLTQASNLGYCILATSTGGQVKDGNLLLTFNAAATNVNDKLVKQRLVGGSTISGW